MHDEYEEAALLRVLRSGLWCRLEDADWTSGECGLFEHALCEYLGVAHALLMVNGTEAIDLALRALGVRPGDEILVQASTFFGTVTPIVRLGAIPVFVDIDPKTFCVDLDCLESRITPKTVGIVVPHLFGLCPDMTRLSDLCERYRLWLVEDCAQALGSVWEGRRSLGTVGNVGTFSFQQDKVITAGEGGAVVCHDIELLGRIFALHHGFTVPGAPEHSRTEISSNLRATAWQAAVLRCQLARLDELLDRKRKNLELLHSMIGKNATIEPIHPHPRLTRWGMYAAPFRFSPEVAPRRTHDALLKRLQDAGVPCFEGHMEPLYVRPLFRDNAIVHRNAGCPVSDRIAQESLCIMHWFFLGDTDDVRELADLINH